MTSRTHAQQAAEEMREKRRSTIMATATVPRLYGADEEQIIERHIAAALAEQEAEQWIDVREDLPKSVKSWRDGSKTVHSSKPVQVTNGVAQWVAIYVWFDGTPAGDWCNGCESLRGITHWREVGALPRAKG